MKFNYDGQTYDIVRINRMAAIVNFKEAAMPICMAHLRPIEIIFSVFANGFAPMNHTLGLIDSLTSGQKEIDRSLLKAYIIMLDHYDPSREHKSEDVSATITDLDWLYDIVYAQIEADGILESVLSQKMAIIGKVLSYAGIPFSQDKFKTDAQEFISRKIKEFGAGKNA